MAALIFTLMPAFFGGELGAFARGFPPCILCSDDKKMPYGAALADKLSKRSGLSVKAVLGPRALCNRKANATLYQHFQGIIFQIHSGRNCTTEALQQEGAVSAELSRKQRLLEPTCHCILPKGLGRTPSFCHTEAFKIQTSHAQNTYSCRTQHKLDRLRPTFSPNDFYLRSV